MLIQQVSTIARLASPDGGARNPTKALYVLGGRNVTLDPTFAAHTLPVLNWAMAHWEDWVSKSALEAAYLHVKEKLGSKKASWNSVAGPAAALWVTLNRAGWQWTSSNTFLDDLGDPWDALTDRRRLR